METERPLITFAVFTFNQESYVRDAVTAALAQTYSPLEVIISDDCSSDGTFGVALATAAGYSGQHDVKVQQTAVNVGLAEHVNQVVRIARGEIIVAAAGDDISLPERTELIYAAYLDSGKQAMSIFSNAIVIDKDGQEIGFYMAKPDPESLTSTSMAQRGGGVLGATHAWNRKVFEQFGPLLPDVTREDVVIPFRSALIGKVTFIDAILVKYRLHGNNLNLASVRDIRDVQQFHRLLARHAGRDAIYRNYLRDLTTLRRVDPSRQSEIDSLSSQVDLNIRDQGWEAQLFNACLGERLRIILRAIRAGTRKRRIVRWCLWFLTPQIYLGFLRTASLIKRLQAHLRFADSTPQQWIP